MISKPGGGGSRPLHVVHFRLRNDGAQHVCVAGTFNDWKPEENPLRRNVFGEWETTLLLAPGDYQYRFLIDGEWAADPLARQQIVTPFGSVHAVLHLDGAA